MRVRQPRVHCDLERGVGVVVARSAALATMVFLHVAQCDGDPPECRVQLARALQSASSAEELMLRTQKSCRELCTAMVRGARWTDRAIAR
jgi:hypothetical protein